MHVVLFALSLLFTGIFYASAMLGPALGYIGGGQLLNLYVDYPKLPPELVSIHLFCCLSYYI